LVRQAWRVQRHHWRYSPTLWWRGDDLGVEVPCRPDTGNG
jgi:hypothetical protein